MSEVGKTSGRPPRRARSLFVGLLALVLAATALYVNLKPRDLAPPVVSTDGLDPAVAKLIDDALNEARGQPRSGEAWGKLGSVLMHYEFVPEARLAFSRAESLSPKDPRWPYLQAMLLLPRQPQVSVVLLRIAVELSPERPDMPRLQLAQLLAERGELVEAEKHFLTLLKLTTNHPPALLGLARLRRGQGKLDEAEALLRRCLDSPHTAKSAHALLAQILLLRGDGAGAETATRRAAALPADTPWPDPFLAEAAAFRVGRKALVQEATALLDQNRFDLALNSLARLTRDFPGDDEGWYLTGWTLNQLQRSTEAERALREHLHLSPQSAKGHAQLAVALLQQNRFADAIPVLEAGLKLKPTWRELHFNLGFACSRLGRNSKAIAHLRDALMFDPGHVPTHTALAELLLRATNTNDARVVLLQALELDPANTRARLLLQSISAGQ